MKPEDANKAKQISAVLVKNYVDTAKIDVEVISSTAYLSGELVLFDSAFGGRRPDDLTEMTTGVKKICSQIEQEIRRVAQVSTITWQLRNWEKVGIRWVQKKT